MDITGSGFLYPIVLTENSSGLLGWNISSGTELLESDLISLFTTQLGLRLRQEDYGNRFDEVLEEPNNTVQQYYIKTHLSDIISKWEPRVIPPGVDDIVVTKVDSVTIEVALSLLLKSGDILDLKFNFDTTLI